jgi:hypothetical protein
MGTQLFTGTWRGLRLNFPFYQELESCDCPKKSILVTGSSCDMSPRREVAWEEWEEKNLLPWVDAHRVLPWKARSHAYYEQYQVDRSVESLRGKKYHILRKQCRIGARPLEHPGHPSHQIRAGAHRSAGHKASLTKLTSRRPAQSNKCFQTILRTESSHIDSIESAKTKDSRPGIN